MSTETFIFIIKFSVIGILIVFACLAVITFVITLVRRTDTAWAEREERQRQEAGEKEPTIDTITLVLIAAAAATMIEGRFYIKRIRRLLPRDAVRGPWSMQGRAILHGSHVVSKKR